MKQADTVLQEVWKIKDAAFEAAGHDPKRFVQNLRERSAALREGLSLQALDIPSKAPRIATVAPATKP